MDSNVDYDRIDPDPDKEPHEYHYTERRAEILTAIENAGTPKRLDASALAERYDVHRNTIYLDFDRLAEFVADNIGHNVEARTQNLYEKASKELLKQERFMEAWRVTMEWNEWLENRGVLDREPAKVEADVTQREARTESESYTIEEDDASITAEQEQEPEQETD